MTEASKIVDIFASPMPFSNQRVHGKIKEGATIEQIVGAYTGGKPHLDAVVFINDYVIPHENWHCVRPKSGCVVNIRVVPQGGGGKKNPLASLLSIALLVAAPAMSGALLGSMANTTILGGLTTYGKVLGSVIGMVGNLLVNAIAPPPRPSNAGNAVNNQAESPTQFIEGARNSVNRYGAIPVCLGTNRMFPPQAALPFQESTGGKQYVRQLFCWGYGDELELSDIKIGETDISQYREVQTQHKLEGNLHEGTGLYPSDVFQDEYTVALTFAVGFVTRTTQIDTDEIDVELAFINGLSRFTAEGQRVATSVYSRIEYKLTTDAVWTLAGDYVYTEATATSLRRSHRIVFPSRGQYDVRVKRVSADSVSDQIIDAMTWAAMRSYTVRPPVNLEGINGTAVRILGTDQLNGSLDLLNAIVSNKIPDYDSGTSSWIMRATSNPASIYRYVLQGGANGRAVADSRVDITALEEWHAHCESKGYTYNRVIDYDTNLYAVLQDVASAGRASPTIIDGRFSVVVDKEKTDIVQIVTPRNSWGYSAEFIYPDLPHAFRVQFRNKEKGYQVDERIVYDDGYDASSATKFEVLEYLSCTDSDLAYIHGREHIATVRLRPEKHMFYMDVENIVMTRGDRFKFAHDIPIVGVGDGRIKSITTSGSDITEFTIDDEAEFSLSINYYVRVRKSDFTQLYLPLGNALSGNLNAFALQTPIAISGGFEVGDLCYFVEAGGELDLIVSKIEPIDDLAAKITALDYAPAIFNAATGTIPSFDSNITTPLSLQRPSAPVFISVASDESVMTRNSDGSYTSKMVVTLSNTNDGQIQPVVIYRLSGTDTFQAANILEASPERVVITGLEDGLNYDVWISYKRNGTTMQSLPLQLNNYKFIGASASPSDVVNFRSNITGGMINLSWDANADIDISHYSIKFSRVFSGASWETAQDLEPIINETRITLPFIGGTYLIKAIDLLGNESDSAAVIITYESASANVVQTIQEETAFSGTKDNVSIRGGNSIVLDDVTAIGYYYFATDSDIGGVFESQLSASVVANGAFTNNLYDIDDIYDIDDLFGSADNDVFAMDDIYAIEDLFGIGSDGWSVKLQIRTTQDDPLGSPVWSDWADFVAGNYTFWDAEFRLVLQSTQPGITPQVTVAQVVIDMPDRIERGKGLAVSPAGYTVTYSTEFNAEPAVGILLQDAATDDRIEFTSKTASGFTFKVYNATLATYVTRVFDFIASGYGRVQ